MEGIPEGQAVVEEEVIPKLVRNLAPGAALRAWSTGCASGEEPYTLSIIWRMDVALRFPECPLDMVATNLDPQVLERAHEGCYSASSLKERTCSESCWRNWSSVWRLAGPWSWEATRRSPTGSLPGPWSPGTDPSRST